MKKILQDLKKIATHLDNLHQIKIANRIDSILRALANDQPLDPENEEKLLQRSTEELEQAEYKKMFKEKSFIEEMLSDRGINDVYPPENYADYTFIGKGAIGEKVLKKTYQGEDVAVKLIKGTVEEKEGSEIDIWEDILKIKETMPPNLQKHFPQIYKMEKVMDNSGKKLLYEIIVMERLEPINSYLKELLFGINETNRSLLDHPIKERLPALYIFQNEELMNELLKQITFDFKDLDSNEKSILLKGALSFSTEEYYKEYKEYLKRSLKNDPKEISENFSPKIDYIKMAKDFEKHLLNIASTQIKENKELIDMIKGETNMRFRNIVESADFPRGHDTQYLNPHFSTIPETQSLIRSLQE